MNIYPRFLLGVLALGLHGGLAAAQGPETANRLAAPLTAAPQTPGLVEAWDDTNPRGPARWVGGVGLYLVQPYFENNPAYNLLSETHSGTSTPTGATAQRVNVSQHMQAAPLIWLGYVGADGLGARARYWYFRQGTDQTVNLPPFTGDYDEVGDDVIQMSGTLYTLSSATPQGLQAFGNTLSRDFGPQATVFNVQTKLEVQALDLEVCQDFRFGRWEILASGGVRLVRLVQTYNVYQQESTSAAEFRTLLSGHDFEGAGPVLAVELRRQFGASGLHFVSSLRGAVVMGSARQNAIFGGIELRNDDPNPQVAVQHWNRGLPIAELELGLEYARDLGPAQLFAQVALVGQQWFGAGNSSRSTGLSPPHSPNPVLGGAPVDSDLAFFGVAFRLGWNF